MLSEVLPEILAVDHAKRGPPRDLGGVVPLEILTVDHPKRGSPRNLGGGLC